MNPLRKIFEWRSILSLEPKESRVLLIDLQLAISELKKASKMGFKHKGRAKTYLIQEEFVKEKEIERYKNTLRNVKKSLKEALKNAIQIKENAIYLEDVLLSELKANNEVYETNLPIKLETEEKEIIETCKSFQEIIENTIKFISTRINQKYGRKSISYNYRWGPAKYVGRNKLDEVIKKLESLYQKSKKLLLKIKYQKSLMNK